jgi:hypothetical protein
MLRYRRGTGFSIGQSVCEGPYLRSRSFVPLRSVFFFWIVVALEVAQITALDVNQAFLPGGRAQC